MKVVSLAFLILALAVVGAGCSPPGGLLSDAPDCEADFSWELTVTPNGVLAQFTDESKGDITGWKWNFNDDRTIDSWESNPKHLYTRNELNNVTLTVTSTDCGRMTKKKLLRIEGCPT